MAVPKKRRSKARKRTHRSNWTCEVPNLSTCPQCNSLKHSHRACTVCGTYKGRQVIQIKIKEPEQKES